MLGTGLSCTVGVYMPPLLSLFRWIDSYLLSVPLIKLMSWIFTFELHQTSEGAIEDHGVTRITDSIQSDPGISRTTEDQPGRHKAQSSLTWFGNIGAPTFPTFGRRLEDSGQNATFC